MAGGEKQPWSRMPGESAKAYEAFARYLEIPHRPENPTDRSCYKVAKELGKSQTLMCRWSSLYDWPERAAEYDAYLRELDRKEMERERRAMQKRHIKMGQLLQQKGLEKLKTLQPERVTPQQAAAMLVDGIRVERDAYGPALLEVEETVDQAVQHTVVFATREEMEKAERLLAERSKAR